MNAYELADVICNCTTDPLHKEVAEMLRQQAKRIDELESDFKKLFWMLDEKNKQLHKELSDEEITKLYWQSTWGSDDDAINFARTIIKASRGEE